MSAEGRNSSHSLLVFALACLLLVGLLGGVLAARATWDDSGDMSLPGAIELASSPPVSASPSDAAFPMAAGEPAPAGQSVVEAAYGSTPQSIVRFFVPTIT